VCFDFDYSTGKTRVSIITDFQDQDPIPHTLPVPTPKIPTWKKRMRWVKLKPSGMECKTIVQQMIRHNSFMFYTGAGISAGVIPTTDELLRDLGNQDNLITNVTNYPEKYTDIADKFFQRCAKAEPTQAHKVLHEIIDNTGDLLITENFDLLHQKAGDTPLTNSDFSILCNKFAVTRMLITIGLDSDESDLLSLYEQLNPYGLIVAINIQKFLKYPPYSYLIHQDIQIAIQEMLHYFKVLTPI
jgi:hypothetical protein